MKRVSSIKGKAWGIHEEGTADGSQGAQAEEDVRRKRCAFESEACKMTTFWESGF